MRNILSIFNSKSCPFAGWAFVVAVIAIEVMLSRELPGRFFSHEVDRKLYIIDHTAGDVDFLFIGDSVGANLVWLAAKKMPEIEPGGRLGTNQVVEMAGNYYLIKRYLRLHKRPVAVVFVGGLPESVNLDQASNETFIQRCFLRWEEIAELTTYKGFRFGCVMLVHKLLPSYRYRYHLQKKIAGFTNASIYDGLTKEEAADKDSGGPGEDFRVTGSLYEVYFKKLLDMLSKEDIGFYYILPPVSSARWARDKERYAVMEPFWAKCRREYPAFRYYGKLFKYPDECFNKDQIHLKGVGAFLATKDLIDHITRIEMSLAKRGAQPL
jgi:hypothetical protein